MVVCSRPLPEREGIKGWVQRRAGLDASPNAFWRAAGESLERADARTHPRPPFQGGEAKAAPACSNPGANRVNAPRSSCRRRHVVAAVAVGELVIGIELGAHHLAGGNRHVGRSLTNPGIRR